jgi:SAM-dependent methyltransferase
MTQITKSIRSISSCPIVCTSFQCLMGAKSSWTNIANNYIKAKQGNTFLDIGCGPADIIDYIPSLEHWGFDIIEQYIQKAKLKYAGRGSFNSQYLDEATLDALPKFDIVLMFGVLHHMDDDSAKVNIKLAHKALKTGGRLVAIDPALPPQSKLICTFSYF